MAGRDHRREVQLGRSVNLVRLLGDTDYSGQRGSNATQTAAHPAFELVQFPLRTYSRASIE